MKSFSDTSFYGSWSFTREQVYLAESIICLNSTQNSEANIRCSDLFRVFSDTINAHWELSKFKSLIALLEIKKQIKISILDSNPSDRIITHLQPTRILQQLKVSPAQHLQVIERTIFLNQLIKSAEIVFATPSFFLSQKMELAASNKFERDIGFKIATCALEKVEKLRWSEIVSTEMSGSTRMYDGCEFNELFKIYKLLETFSFWIFRNDHFIEKTLEHFRNITVREYTNDFLSSFRYIYILKLLWKELPDPELVVIKDLKEIHHPQHYYLFFQTWKSFLGEHKLIVLYDENREKIISDISGFSQSAEDDLSEILKTVIRLSSLLGWQNHLSDAVNKLTNKIISEAAFFQCSFCSLKDSGLRDGYLVCRSCGYSSDIYFI